LRAKGGGFALARDEAFARADDFAGVLSEESLLRRDGAVPRGEERTGSARLERAREDAGAASTAPALFSLRLVLDPIALVPRLQTAAATICGMGCKMRARGTGKVTNFTLAAALAAADFTAQSGRAPTGPT
jgi:hypothetical protein